ncbi:Pr6Pr family membrane protein [Formosa sp. PL04]|uniref:Pr6Pr family membrane protein n=1 Tax=Formosa sp. PL04 TaxID=3081755 RepID=UPI00298289C8|nr:Pr6Pr family membrane protein [Formosa sp. PL04]MDW5290362.1 Pr6Pr family membrane protein [Formosa sp. PL04]
MNRKFETLGFSIVWFAIIAQFFLMLENRIANVPETIIRFFSFFTILTNILVALFLTTHVFRLKKYPFNLFFAKGTLTAITAFILIVGLVYQIVLRHIWEPTGLQYVVDELLHTIIPLFMFGYWFFNIKKEDLLLKPILNWLIFPSIYLIFIIVRGYLSGYYPYPFLNIEDIGYKSALINIAVILSLTIVIMIALSSIGKYKFKNNTL